MWCWKESRTILWIEKMTNDEILRRVVDKRTSVDFDKEAVINLDGILRH